MARIKNFLTPQWLKEFEELKRQAASDKRQATKTQAASDKHQAWRHKPQASSRKRQAAQS